jgi:hypothetical protein
MRKLFILGLILTFSFSKGQDYIPLLKSSNDWYYINVCEGFCSDNIKILGDTVYDSKEYKIIGSKYHQLNDLYPYYGFIREDTIEQKVYYLPNGYSPQVEELLYDFSINDGDSITLNHNGQDSDYYVDSVRNFTTIIDTRKAYYLRGPANEWGYSKTPIWVEGIGALSNLLSSSDWYGGPLGLGCFYSNDIKIFQSELSKEYGVCELNTSVINDSQKDEIRIYPNPFRNYINIKGETSIKISRIELLNVNGQILISKETENNSGSLHEILEISEIECGIYYLRIISDDYIYTKSVVRIAEH